MLPTKEAYMKPTGTVGYAAMFEQFHPTDLLELE